MDIFSFIKTRISILDVAQQYTTLKKAGMYWKGCCPFHQERTGSFTVSPHKNIFYCFGCHAGGDIVAFMTKAENYTPLQAAQHLAERYRIDLPETLQHEAPSRAQRDQYQHTCKTVALWCQKQLERSTAAREYVAKRGLEKPTLELYNVGFFPTGARALKDLVTVCQQENILLADLMNAHILYAKENGSYYSPFEERVIFPITDSQGRFCGFGGRTYRAEDVRVKYYNSHEHEFFSKGSILYGLSQAKKAIQDRASVYLVEGYMDCLALAQAGYPNAVATLGTACTQEHLKTLARYAQKLHTLYDGDNAGQKAVLRLTQLCWDVELDPYVVVLPDKEDPASLVAQGKDLTPFLEQAVDIFTFFINTTTNGFETLPLNERLSRVKAILQVINGIQDPLKRSLLLEKTSAASKIPVATLLQAPQEVKKSAVKPANDRPTPEGPKDAQIEISDLEKKLFSAIISSQYRLNQHEFTFLKFTCPEPLWSILERHQEALAHNPQPAIADVCKDGERDVVMRILMEDEITGPGMVLQDLLAQFYKKQWKLLVHRIKIETHKAQKLQDFEKVTAIITQFQQLKQKFFKKDQA